MSEENKITCGNCKSEYLPRQNQKLSSFSDILDLDYSCPVCGHGKQFNKENFQKQSKQILKD